VKEWANPSGATSLPYAMTMDDRDRVWFVETGVRPNRLVGFDPKTETFFSNTPVVPSGGGTVRHMVFEPKTRAIWWGSDTNQLGRAEIGPVRANLVP
jgi:virginiamycin B lyase